MPLYAYIFYLIVTLARDPLEPMGTPKNVGGWGGGNMSISWVIGFQNWSHESMSTLR